MELFDVTDDTQSSEMSPPKTINIKKYYTNAISHCFSPIVIFVFWGHGLYFITTRLAGLFITKCGHCHIGTRKRIQQYSLQKC